MKKKKINVPLIITIILDAVFCAVYGYFVGELMFEPDNPFSVLVKMYLVFLIGFVISNFLHIAMHEAGHMVFGLLTGYRLLSYRVGSLMVTSENGRLVFSRYSVPGTAGQCLMNRPEDPNNRSYFWYNAGGVIFNLLGILIAHLLLLLKMPALLKCFLLVFAFTGWTLALTNGIPMITSVANDAMNIVEMSRHSSSIDSFQNSLEITRQQLEGLRIKNLDESLIIDDEEALKAGALGASNILLRENKLIDQHEFDKVRELIQLVREKEYPVLPLQLNYLALDERYIACLEGTYQSDEDKDLQKLIKAGSGMPNVQRFLYAKALFTHDSKLQAQAEKNIEKIKENYPFKGDLESELELMEVARERLSEPHADQG